MIAGRPPLLLLPASKGKVEGGSGVAYGPSLAASDHPLSCARRQLLAAVGDGADGLDVASLARLTGVPRARAEAQRASLAAVGDAPTLPAHRRYSGVVHANAGLASFDAARAGVEVVVVSALLGVAGMADPTPAYRLELGASLPGVGRLGSFWRQHAAAYLAELTTDRRVWDLLPGEHARVWPAAARTHVPVIEVRFVRDDGRAANAARTKVAKGRLAAALIADPSLTPERLDGSRLLGDGWMLRSEAGVTATWRGD